MPGSVALPHGPYSILVVVLAVSGWLSSLWGGDGCNYALVSGPIVDQLHPSYTKENPVKVLQLGFDSYREPVLPAQESASESDSTSESEASKPLANATIGSLLPDWLTSRNKDKASANATEPGEVTTGGGSTDASTAGACTEYPEQVTLGIVDSSWNTARVFCFLGLVLGGGGAAFLACSLCVVFSRVTWRWTAYELLGAGLCQTVSLCGWFRTQLCSWNDCSLSEGSVSDLLATALWVACGLLMVGFYPPASSSHGQAVGSGDARSPGKARHRFRCLGGSREPDPRGEGNPCNGHGDNDSDSDSRNEDRNPSRNEDEQRYDEKRRYPLAEIA